MAMVVEPAFQNAPLLEPDGLPRHAPLRCADREPLPSGVRVLGPEKAAPERFRGATERRSSLRLRLRRGNTS